MTTNFPKPRPDSKLKNLAEPHQDQIAEFARNHSLAQTAQWLARHRASGLYGYTSLLQHLPTSSHKGEGGPL